MEPLDSRSAVMEVESYQEIDCPESSVWSDIQLLKDLSEDDRSKASLNDWGNLDELLNTMDLLFSDGTKYFCKENLFVLGPKVFYSVSGKEDGLVCVTEVDEFCGIQEITIGRLTDETLPNINKHLVLEYMGNNRWMVQKWHNTGTSGLNVPLETAFFEFDAKNN